MIHEKLEEFSFEVKDDWHECNLPEVGDLQEIIDSTIESYKMLIKAGKIKEAHMVLEKVKDTMYAKEHLKLVMGMDFSRPTAKMIELAKENNIDLNDPNVIQEFRKIQQQNLRDIHMLKQGKQPQNPEEMTEKLQKKKEREFKKKMQQLEKEQKAEKKPEPAKKGAQEGEKSSLRDQMFIGVVLVLWVGMIVYSNFSALFKSH